MGQIQSFSDSVLGNSNIEFGDINKSCYQELVDLSAEGINGVEHQQIQDSFKDSHAKTLSRIYEVEKRLVSIETQLKQVTILY